MKARMDAKIEEERQAKLLPSSIAFEFIRLMRNDSISSGVAELRNRLSAMATAICTLNSVSAEKMLSFAIICRA